MEIKKLYTIPEVAALLSVSRSQVYQLLKDNQLKSVKMGGSRRVADLQLNAYINALLSQEEYEDTLSNKN